MKREKEREREVRKEIRRVEWSRSRGVRECVKSGVVGFLTRVPDIGNIYELKIKIKILIKWK